MGKASLEIRRKAKPKPMKPVKAWIVHGPERRGLPTLYQSAESAKFFHFCVVEPEKHRIARVEIRELLKRKPAKGK